MNLDTLKQSPFGLVLAPAKLAIYTVLGFLKYHLKPRIRVVLVLSSMRSGSTLLKSLMAQGEDVSLLDEFHFIPYANHNQYFFYYLVSRLSDKPIIVLKKPFNNVAAHLPLYGKTPLSGVRNIVLYRHPYETLLSLKALQRRKQYGAFSDEQCVAYWGDTYEAVFNNVDTNRDTLFVRYEHLTGQTEYVTRQIFEFIGSAHAEGARGYGDYVWKAGLDDDSDKIRSRTVHEAEVADPAGFETFFRNVPGTNEPFVFYMYFEPNGSSSTFSSS
ncbi:MAG TPA: sulfotransferase domain-containing protein, partial [Thiobacillus sp.]